MAGLVAAIRLGVIQGLVGVAERYLRKGSKVYIEGRLQTRSWEGQDGQKKYRETLAKMTLKTPTGAEDKVWQCLTCENVVVSPTLPLPGGERIVHLRNYDVQANDPEPRALHDFVVWRQAMRSVTDSIQPVPDARIAAAVDACSVLP